MVAVGRADHHSKNSQHADAEEDGGLAAADG